MGTPELPPIGLDPGMYMPEPRLADSARRSYLAYKGHVTRSTGRLSTLCTNLDTMTEKAAEENKVIATPALRQAISSITRQSSELDESTNKVHSAAERYRCIANLQPGGAPAAALDAELAQIDEETSTAQLAALTTLSKTRDPDPAAPATTINRPAAPTDDGPPKAVEALKPTELETGATATEVDEWMNSFASYYDNSKFHKCSLQIQREYLRKCLGKKLKALVFANTSDLTPVNPREPNGFMTAIRQAFEDDDPLINRRLEYIEMRQAPSETYDLFMARLTHQEQLAKITDITPEDLMIMMRVTGCKQPALKDDILRLESLSLPAITKVSRRFKVRQAQMGNAKGTEPVNQVSTAKKPTNGKCICCAAATRIGPAGKSPYKFCDDCFQGQKYKKLKCSKCKTTGNHSDAACTGSNVRWLPKRPTTDRKPSRGNSPAPSGRDSPHPNGRKGKGPSDYSKKNPAFKNRADTPANNVQTSGDEYDDAEDEEYLNAVTIESSSITVEEDEVVSTIGDTFNLDNMSIKAGPTGSDKRLYKIRTCPDTGCRRTIIAADLASKMGLTLTQSESVRIKAANKSTMSNDGSATIVVNYQGSTIHTKVLVTSSLEGRMLIGRNDLTKLGVIHPSFPDSIHEPSPTPQ